MLIQNGTLAGVALSFTGGAVGGFANSRSRNGWSIANARAFGSARSWPQGYNSPSAVRMPIKTGGNIAARLIGGSAFSGVITATGNASATLSGEGVLQANAQMGAAIYALLQGESGLSGGITALGGMAVNIDAGARPSAFDVAQEVWQSQSAAYNAQGTMGQKVNSVGASSDPWSVQLEGTFTAADLLRIASAVLAGKVSGAGSGTETFRSVDDTRDAVVATVDNTGNRTAITVSR